MKRIVREQRREHERLKESQRHLRYKFPSWVKGWQVESRTRARKLNRRKRYQQCRSVRYINAVKMGGYEISKRRRKDDSVAKIMPDGTLEWL